MKESESELKMIRERFIVNYSKKKGWNYKNLTTKQMLEIVTKPEYKNPVIILG
jgi:hypothetical protein